MTQPKTMTPLQAAAQAVLDRWDSPAWEWSKQGSTAELMAALRLWIAPRPFEMGPNVELTGPQGPARTNDEH